MIDGWERAIKTMKVGESAEITCSSEYGNNKNYMIIKSIIKLVFNNNIK